MMSQDHKDLIERLRIYARDYPSTAFLQDTLLDSAEAIAALVAERDAAVAALLSVMLAQDLGEAKRLAGEVLDKPRLAARQNTEKP
jgi:hypothetical protein